MSETAKMRDGLSKREDEVLSWLQQGMSNKEIALQLEISPRTVQKHLQRIYLRLNVQTRAEAVVRMRRGMRETHNQDGSLSKREDEVLSWLQQGMSYKEIALQLKISPRTVQSHLQHIYLHLDVHARAEAVVRMRRSIRETHDHAGYVNGP